MEPKKTEKLQKLIVKTKKGFSIAEVMLSIFLLSVGMIAIIALMANSIKNNANNRNSIIATQLAQEGIELVRNRRDLNIALLSYGAPAEEIEGKAFVNIDEGKNYCPGIVEGEVEMLGNCSGLIKYNNDDNGPGYNHLSGEDTIFYRRVSIIDLNDDTKRLVRSMVVWNEEHEYLNVDECSISNKCVYVELTLSNTGWR